MTRNALTLLLFGLTLLPSLACAASWQPLPSSTLEFEGEAQGESFRGKFASFTALIEFDPATLADSRFEVEIELGSVDSQNEERDDMLAEPAFFDSANQPKARYVADAFEAVGESAFRANGVLTLRGVERPVTLDFRWVSEGDKASLVGSATLDRLAFDVGAGEWADPEAIATEVRVMTRLDLVPAATDAQ